MLWLQTLLACAPSDIGANEDELGQPRSLLGDCVQRDLNGEEVHYDSNGYVAARISGDGTVLTEEHTELDGLGRPLQSERFSPQLGQVILRGQYGYVGETWQLDSIYEVDGFGEQSTQSYTWVRGAYLVEGDSLCVRYVELAAGIRPRQAQLICDGELVYEALYTWSNERVTQMRELLHNEPELEFRHRYIYGLEGRLQSVNVQAGGGGDADFVDYLELDYTWDCQS
jgi:hypothetical protein